MYNMCNNANTEWVLQLNNIYSGVQRYILIYKVSLLVDIIKM